MKHSIGMDEVGRGALAGPVVTAAVCFEQEYKIRDFSLPVLIDDSKKLTAKKRKDAAQWIYENAIFFGIGESSVSKINKLGIVRATESAFRNAFKSIPPLDLDFVYIDAFYIKRLGVERNKQKPIIHGDSLIFTIAAASIIAKVYRDELMEKLGNKEPFKPYLWPKNKGYGTKEHCLAIKKYGTTKQHRTLFVRNLFY